MEMAPCIRVVVLLVVAYCLFPASVEGMVRHYKFNVSTMLSYTFLIVFHMTINSCNEFPYVLGLVCEYTKSNATVINYFTIFL